VKKEKLTLFLISAITWKRKREENACPRRNRRRRTFSPKKKKDCVYGAGLNTYQRKKGERGEVV